MIIGRRGWRLAAVTLGVAMLAACEPTEGGRVAKSTLVLGIDVSGSFTPHYDDAIRFASHYLYGHIHGLGGLRPPTAVFVGSVGGAKPGQSKSFQPITAFEDKTPEEIEAFLRAEFPSEDSFTEYNTFFDRVATLVKRQGLVLAPLEIVMLSDGQPDLTGRDRPDDVERYASIILKPLEYLSRSVTVRLLYASPDVSVHWERSIPRNRVRMWTVDAPVMKGWNEKVHQNVALDMQDDLWSWIVDNVDFRVRTRRL